MSLRKPKKSLQAIGARCSRKLLVWRALGLEVPMLLAVVVVGVVVYLPPTSSHVINSQRTAHKKGIASHVSAAPKPKATQPVAAAPQAVAAAPSPAPAKTPVPVAGTSKAEPVVTPAPASSVSGLAPTAPASGGSQTPNTQVATGYTSTNWSGYLAANASFTGVSGSWSATSATGNGSTVSADSTWIGIGGVTSSDLIQVGTQNTITASGQVSTSAFYEMLPNASQTVPGVTVSPGDSMTASLSQISAGQWRISITDNTDHQSFTLVVAYASSLSSAEWIEEDPSFSFRRQAPFDNFHEASFAGGSTVANGTTLSIAGSTAQPVTMVNGANQPVAVPSAILGDGASFTVSP